MTAAGDWVSVAGMDRDMLSEIVLVSGLPRSGTSMMMQMLAAGGLEIVSDEERTADVDNPRGYYELESVKRTKADPSWLDRAEGKVIKLIASLLMDLPEAGDTGSPDNVLVDAGSGRRRYKVVFMRRHLDEVLRSQRKMLRHRGEDSDMDDAEMKELFVSHLEQVEAWLRTRDDIDALFVSYNRLIENPRRAAERVTGFLAVDMDVDAMLAAVDPSLYRNRK